MHKLFPSQLDNETVYLVVREHWFHLFLKMLIPIFFIVTLVLFQIYGQTWAPGLFDGEIGVITLLFTRLFMMLIMLTIFLIFVFYYLNIQIITDLRIVDVDQVGLFHHVVSELHIDKIEDVTSEISGVFGTIFNYGDVYVQTAAAVEKFEFTNVPNPSAIEKIILDLYEKNTNHSLKFHN